MILSEQPKNYTYFYIKSTILKTQLITIIHCPLSDLFVRRSIFNIITLITIQKHQQRHMKIKTFNGRIECEHEPGFNHNNLILTYTDLSNFLKITAEEKVTSPVL